MAVWDDVIPASDLAVYQVAGYGRESGLGQTPALIVIDMTYAFIGDRSEPVLDSARRWPHSCGEEGWRAVPHIARVIAAARAARVPIAYTRGIFKADASDAGTWQGKLRRGFEQPADRTVDGDDFVRELAPQPGDIVVHKDKPSAFFGTPLLSKLIERRVDTVVVTGCTTSGCVRGTVCEAFSNNYKVAVVEEGVFDRAVVPHKVSLFDLQQKYADVISTEAACAYLARCRTAGADRIAA
jgi:nicotinamidase-related amidase